MSDFLAAYSNYYESYLKSRDGNNSDLDPTLLFTVTFIVTNTMGVYIENIDIEFNNTTQQTDVNGTTVFTDIGSGIYYFTAITGGVYVSQSDYINVAEDRVIWIILEVAPGEFLLTDNTSLLLINSTDNLKLI